MPLDDEDKRKLHAAINQIDNQRLWLTTLAITFFGTGIGWWLGKPTISASDGRLPYIFSIFMMSVLFLIFLYSHFLKRMLRTFSTYLLVHEASSWEKDRQTFRRQFRAGVEWHERAQTMIFLFLGIGTALLPWIAAYLNQTSINYQSSSQPISWIVMQSFFATAYLLLVIGLGLTNFGDKEEEIRDQWEGIIKSSEAERVRSSDASKNNRSR